MRINDTVVNEACSLSDAAVDRIAGQVESFAAHLCMERRAALRTRISVEEILLRWRDHFGDGTAFSFSMGVRWRRPYLALELRGEVCNPLLESSAEEEWSSILLGKLGLAPQYTYEKGKNCVFLPLERPRRNPALKLMAAIGAAVCVGLGSRAVFPAAALDTLAVTVLTPVYNAFLRLLNLAAGPVIFLSVLSMVYEVGSVAVLGKLWNRLCRRFIGLCFVMSGLAAVACLPVFSLEFLTDPISQTEFSGILDLLLHIIPNDLVTPFIQGSSPSLILLAVILGDILLALGRRWDNTPLLAAQSGFVMQQIANGINALGGYVVFAILLLHLWTGGVRGLLGLWRPMLLCVLLSFAYLLTALLTVSLGKKVGLRTLMGKMKGAFMTALTTGSVADAHEENVACCERGLGISPMVTRYGIPLGSTVYMPGAAVNAVIICFYMADQYEVPISLLWVVMALLLNTILAIATPPISGVSLLNYAVVFSQLGIPSQALGITMMADILMSFTAAALDQALLQMELVIQADDICLLDQQRLRSPEPAKKRKEGALRG